jgi:hypothetical protein
MIFFHGKHRGLQILIKPVRKAGNAERQEKRKSENPLVCHLAMSLRP